MVRIEGEAGVEWQPRLQLFLGARGRGQSKDLYSVKLSTVYSFKLSTVNCLFSQTVNCQLSIQSNCQLSFFRLESEKETGSVAEGEVYIQLANQLGPDPLRYTAFGKTAF